MSMIDLSPAVAVMAPRTSSYTPGVVSSDERCFAQPQTQALDGGVAKVRRLIRSGPTTRV
jgi:hypothetical protein